jgi:hypothetical protein
MAGPSLQVSNFGAVARGQPIPTQEGAEGEVRLGRYRDAYVVPIVPKLHALADEGSYFVANNQGTGVATAAAPTAFSDTAPMFTINNVDTAQNANNKRIYLDWIRITQTAAGTAGVDLRLRGVLDYTVPSGGTLLVPLNMNTDVPKSASIAQPRLLPVGITQSGNSRVVIGTLVAIPTQTTNLTALSEVYLNFGGVDQVSPTYNSAAGTNIVKMWHALPPIVIGPGAVFMLEFLLTTQSAASSWTAECGWWER